MSNIILAFPTDSSYEFYTVDMSLLVGQLISGPTTFGLYFESLVHDSFLEQGEVLVTIEAGQEVSVVDLCSLHFFEFLALAVSLIFLLRH